MHARPSSFPAAIGLTVTERQVGDLTALDLEGHLTIIGHGSGTLRRAIRHLIEEGRRNFVLNLARVSYVDSSGLGELVASLLAITRAGGQLKLLNVRENVREVMEVTRLQTVFEIGDDESSASGFGQQGN